MAVKIGLIFGALVACISAAGALYFLALILLWTFDIAERPALHALHLAIWCSLFVASFYLLKYLHPKLPREVQQ